MTYSITTVIGESVHGFMIHVLSWSKIGTAYEQEILKVVDKIQHGELLVCNGRIFAKNETARTKTTIVELGNLYHGRLDWAGRRIVFNNKYNCYYLESAEDI